MASGTATLERACEYCRIPFTPQRSDARFHSASCRAMAAKQRNVTRNRNPVRNRSRPPQSVTATTPRPPSSPTPGVTADTGGLATRKAAMAATLAQLTLRAATPDTVEVLGWFTTRVWAAATTADLDQLAVVAARPDVQGRLHFRDDDQAAITAGHSTAVAVPARPPGRPATYRARATAMLGWEFAPRPGEVCQVIKGGQRCSGETRFMLQGDGPRDHAWICQACLDAFDRANR